MGDRSMQRVVGDAAKVVLAAAIVAAGLIWPIIAYAQGAEASSGVTRGQWIHELVKTFDVTVEDESYPEEYFTDVSESSPYYGDLVKAVEFGIIDVPAGGEVCADAPATRDFAAHTLNFCLGYQLQDEAYTFSDWNICEHPADDQVAVNRGWFSLVGGKFVPSQAVTEPEFDAAFADAREVWASTDVDENHVNVVEFDEGVKVIPEGTDIAEPEEGVLAITDCPVALASGDTFAVYLLGVPTTYVAQDVSVAGNVTTIVTQKVDAFTKLDYQGVTQFDMAAFSQPDADVLSAQADGPKFELAYADRAITATAAFEAGSGSTKGSADITVKASNLAMETNFNDLDCASVVVTGELSLTGSVSGSWKVSIPVAKMSVPGASIGLDLTEVVSGEAYATTTSSFRAGFQVSGDDVRLVKDFTKKSFTCKAKASLTQDLKLSAGVDLAVVKGEVFAKVGTLTRADVDYIQGAKPETCTTILQCVTASAGVTASVNLGVWSRDFEDIYVMWDENNSPVRTYFHYEDGVQVDKCTRNASDYVTRARSKTATKYAGGGPLWSLDGDGGDIHGSFNVMDPFIYRDKEPVMDVVLNSDKTYVGDLVLLIDHLDLNGHTLRVTGNLYKGEAAIDLDGGALLVGGSIDDCENSVRKGSYSECDNEGRYLYTIYEEDYSYGHNKFGESNVYKRSKRYSNAQAVDYLFFGDGSSSLPFYDISLGSGGQITVGKDYEVSDGTVSLGGGVVTVGGSLLQSGGDVEVGSGTLSVSGDYRMQSVYRSSAGAVSYGETNWWGSNLNMEDPSGVVNVGGSFVCQTPHSGNDSNGVGNLTAGTMYVGGDFNDLSDNSYTNGFQSVESHRVILTKNHAHSVKIESDSSCIKTLEIADGGTIYSWDGVLNVTDCRTGNLDIKTDGLTINELNLDGGLSVDGSVVLDGDFNLHGKPFSLTGSLSITSGWVDFENSEVVVTGDLEVSDGTVSLGGGVVTVGGSLLQSGGDVEVGSGTLSVSGDYRMQSVYRSSAGAVSYGETNWWGSNLNMEDPSGVVNVGGSFVCQPYDTDSVGTLNMGTMCVQGDLIQIGEGAFSTSGSHQMILSGEGRHKVRMDGDESEFARFGITDGGAITSWDGSFNVGFLGSDLSVPTEKMRFYRLNVNGHTVTFNGSLFMEESAIMNTQKGFLTIKGDLIQTDGTVELGRGTMYIEGDYRLQGATTNEAGELSYSASSGFLRMRFPEDELRVGGDFYFQSTTTHGGGLLGDGTLYVTGHFRDLSNGRFRPAGSHLTVLDGKGFREVEFASERDGFNRLMLQQDRQFYVFSREPCWAELVGTDYVDPRFAPEVRAIAVSPNAATLARGDELQFASWVFGVNGFSSEVSWSVEGAQGAATAITADGLLTVGADEPAGTLVVRATSVMDPSVSSTAQVGVSDASFNLADAEVSLPRTGYVYTGSAIEPEPTVTLNGAALAAGEDYEVSYLDNVRAGTATVRVAGVGRYCGEATATFEIGMADLTREGWVDLPGGEKGYARGGSLVRGWMDLGSSKFWFHQDGCMARGWTDVESGGKVMHYYFNPASGNLVRDTWFTIDGAKYYFRPSGNMATGWATIVDGGVEKKYYLDERGQLLTGWQDIEVNGATMHYYFRPSGAMATGWATIDGASYWFRPSGNMAIGWADVDDAYKRFFDDNGQMVKGWQTIGGSRYYFRSSGAMQTGTATIDGVEYEFSDKGVLVGGTLSAQGEEEPAEADVDAEPASNPSCEGDAEHEGAREEATETLVAA